LDDRVQPYSLRKTCAMWMMRQGVPPHEVSMQLGHKLLGITGVYTEYSPDYLLEACVALEKLWLAVCETIARQQTVAVLA
jgi:integrase